jgi:fucose 4-O-acetylase-like acetyltransferase
MNRKVTQWFYITFVAIILLWVVSWAWLDHIEFFSDLLCIGVVFTWPLMWVLGSIAFYSLKPRGKHWSFLIAFIIGGLIAFGLGLFSFSFMDSQCGENTWGVQFLVPGVITIVLVAVAIVNLLVLYIIGLRRKD